MKEWCQKKYDVPTFRSHLYQLHAVTAVRPQSSGTIPRYKPFPPKIYPRRHQVCFHTPRSQNHLSDLPPTRNHAIIQLLLPFLPIVFPFLLPHRCDHRRRSRVPSRPRPHRHPHPPFLSASETTLTLRSRETPLRVPLGDIGYLRTTEDGAVVCREES